MCYGNELSTDVEYLEHHGILGMKWGIRRYQNKDGTLTKAGEKRYAKAKEEYEKLRPKQEKEEEARKNSISNVSDQELMEKINRMRLEQTYRDLMQQEYARLNPKKESYINGKKIAGDIVSKSVTSVGTDVGKFLLGQGANKLFKAMGFKDVPVKFNEKKEKKEKKKDDDDD